MTLPDYEQRKAIAALYGWQLCGWDATPKPDSTVLLSRWEDKHGNVIEAPPTVPTEQESVRQHVITDAGEHQAFLRLPYFGTIWDWSMFLFKSLVRE